MRKTACADLFTVIAIGVVAYTIANVSHEVLGHCGVAGLLNVPCRVISTTYIPLITQPPPWKYNIIVAAGVTGNFTVALFCYLLLRTLRNVNDKLRYFLWLTISVNLFLASGYIAFAPVIKFGDSYILISQLSHQWFWRTVVTAAGAVVLWLSFRFSRRQFEKMLPAGAIDVRSFAWKIVLPPYVAGSSVIVASALFSQLDQKVAQLEAIGGTFALTSWLLLLPFLARPYASDAASTFCIDRSIGWILLGLITLVAVVGVMGHGVTLHV